jgi:Domain of unknown function (DUF4406)
MDGLSAKVYISGPISERPNGNREAFETAADHLKGAGYEPVNPHDVDPVHTGPCFGRAVVTEFGTHGYACHLIADLWALADCEWIFFLADWENSPGARVEAVFAETLGIRRVMGKSPW